MGQQFLGGAYATRPTTPVVLPAELRAALIEALTAKYSHGPQGTGNTSGTTTAADAVAAIAAAKAKYGMPGVAVPGVHTHHSSSPSRIVTPLVTAIEVELAKQGLTNAPSTGTTTATAAPQVAAPQVAATKAELSAIVSAAFANLNPQPVK